jgi:hypothetical protein
MSNLSFARIMYGAAQEHPSSDFVPASNFPTHLSSVTNAAAQPSASPASAPAQGLLHKAWHALIRHN